MTDRVEGLSDLMMMEAEGYAPQLVEEDLSPNERVLVDRLSKTVIDFVDGMRLARPIAKAVVKRLLEKLRQSELKENSVGVIAEGVWRRLNGINRFSSESSDAFLDGCNLAELRIVEDVMNRVDGPISILIGGIKRDIGASVPPQTNGIIIRAVAKKVWPQIRSKLGV